MRFYKFVIGVIALGANLPAMAATIVDTGSTTVINYGYALESRFWLAGKFSTVAAK